MKLSPPAQRMHTAAALDQEGPCWAEVLNKDLNQNILALALYFFYDTEHRKTFQIFFAGDWQHALIQFCYLCWIYIPSLWFLCLHKLFSSHSAIKSDKTLTTHLSDTKRRQIFWTKPFSYSQLNTCAHQWNPHIVMKRPPISAFPYIFPSFCLQRSQCL